MNICKSENEYISLIAQAAQTACSRLKTMLPSVIIGQACLENGYGIPSYWDNTQIEALMKYNNLLGMKSSLLNASWSDRTVWSGKSLTKQTPEVYNGKKVTITDNFRIYDSIEQCFTDYIQFLLYASNNGKGGAPKYGRAVTDIKDPENLIKAINTKGYATNPNYWKSVMAIINKHNLTQYDSVSAPVEVAKVATKKIDPIPIIDVTAQNKKLVPAKRTSSVKWIVCHYLGVENADNPNLYGKGYGGHYYISRAGKIYKAADPKTAVVWQCGGGIQGESRDFVGVAPHRYHKICTNYNSIGIECGVSKDTDWYFSEASQEAYVYLVSKLMDEYGIDYDHVIRHFDVTGKNCPVPWVKKPHKTSWTWEQFKANLRQYRTNGTITVPDGKTVIDNNVEGNYMFATQTVKKGSQGASVRLIQTMLKGLGYTNTDGSPLKIDGDAGSNTINAITQYQKAHGLSVDGIAGAKTWSCLIGL